MAFALLATLFVAIVSACAPRATPPGADVAAGVVGQAGYEFLHWEEGPAIMIWHDFLGHSGSCSTSGSPGFTVDPIHKLQGYAESWDGHRFDWEVETNDGKTAQFWLDGTPYDLSNGTLFIVTMKNEGADVTQLDRDLSRIEPNHTSCVAFAQSDPDLARFVGDVPTTPVTSPTSAPEPTPPSTATPTPLPPTATVTPLPPAPTPTPAPAVERILFAPGATQTTVEGYLPANGTQVYVMGVAAGQYIEVDATVGAIGQGLRFSIVGADGVVVKTMGQAHVRTVVPSTQDYYVELVSDVGAVSYRMSVLIPVRIRFAPGATSAEVAGSLAASGVRSYVLRALAGQRMIVAPHTTQGQVGMVISGADGQVLLSGRVGRPGGVYDGILPTTQDYLISVRAEGGTSADYTLDITIPPPQTDTDLEAVLQVPITLPDANSVDLEFTLINQSETGLYVLKWYTPLEGLGGKIFRIEHDGQPIPYKGPLAMRGDPTPDAYVFLNAGASVSATVDLATAYDFSEPGEYTIAFISPRISHVARTMDQMAGSVDDLGPIQMPSNSVVVEIQSTAEE
jgi:hypothetical protein